MKKKLVIFLLLFVCCVSNFFADGNYVGEGMKGKKLAFAKPTFNNLDLSDETYLSDLVSVFRTDFHDYLGFDIIDVQNTEIIKTLQAQSEGAQYANELSAGQLQFQGYQAFITVSKAGSKYSISVSVTDLTTGEIKGEDIVQNIVKITDVLDSGKKKLIKKIAPKLGVTLTKMGEFRLNPDSAGTITLEQEIDFAKQEEVELQKEYERVSSELSRIVSSGKSLEVDYEVKKAKLEVEQQMASQRLKQAQEKAIRLQESREREIIEEQKSLERSSELQQRILNLSNDVEKVAAEIREQQFDNLSFDDKIQILEKEKKVYQETRDSINSTISAIYVQANEEYNSKKIDIDDISNYRKGEIKDGRPIDVARNLRAADNKELYENLLNEAKKNEKEILSKNTKTLNNLLSKISKDEKDLGIKHTINSFMDNLYFVVDDYDSEKKSWVGTIYFIVNGQIIERKGFEISFNYLAQALNKATYTQDDMNGINRDKYSLYLEDVETYDSMFRMETPLLYLEADIQVLPSSKNNPSLYNIQIFECRFISTTTKKVVCKLQPSFGFNYQSLPMYDIRTNEEISKYNDKLNRKNEMSTMKFFRLGPMICYVPFCGQDLFGCGFGMDLSFAPFLFCGGEMFFGDVFDIDLKLGLYKYLPILNYPCIFTSLGIGFSIYGDDFIVPVFAEVGCDIEIFSFTRLQLKYQLQYDTISNFFLDKCIIGLSLGFCD